MKDQVIVNKYNSTIEPIISNDKSICKIIEYNVDAISLLGTLYLYVKSGNNKTGIGVVPCDMGILGNMTFCVKESNIELRAKIIIKFDKVKRVIPLTQMIPFNCNDIPVSIPINQVIILKKSVNNGKLNIRIVSDCNEFCNVNWDFTLLMVKSKSSTNF